MNVDDMPRNPRDRALWAHDIHISPSLRDGQVLKTGHMIIIGTRPLTDIELAGAEGRYIVRRGMADVLAYIGETVGPQPRRAGRGDEILDLLHAGAWKALDRPLQPLRRDGIV